LLHAEFILHATIELINMVAELSQVQPTPKIKEKKKGLLGC
jgi:hypothetical protein